MNVFYLELKNGKWKKKNLPIWTVSWFSLFIPTSWSGFQFSLNLPFHTWSWMHGRPNCLIVHTKYEMAINFNVLVYYQIVFILIITNVCRIFTYMYFILLLPKEPARKSTVKIRKTLSRRSGYQHKLKEWMKDLIFGTRFQISKHFQQFAYTIMYM